MIQRYQEVSIFMLATEAFITEMPLSACETYPLILVTTIDFQIPVAQEKNKNPNTKTQICELNSITIRNESKARKYFTPHEKKKKRRKKLFDFKSTS